MCYERRYFTSDQQKKASTVESAKERDSKREETVSNLLREADKAGQKAETAPAREYTPAK